MLRIYFICFFLLNIVNANSIKNEPNVDILAKNVITKENKVIAKGDVVAFSKSFYVTSQKMIYDKENSTLEFFDDVTIVRESSETSFSEYLFINLEQEIKDSKPVVLIDQKSKMWFSSKQIKSEKQRHEFESTVFSSCDCNDPSWSVGFSNGNFNSDKQWVNMYNATLFIKEVPVLYTPYFGFSTNRTRSTGFLTPTVGVSSGEGFVYAQPYYYAGDVDYDIEYIPQIRTNRGYGHTLKYRLADSPYSFLSMEGGIFYENDSYFEEEELTNKKHYGWNVSYYRSKLFSNQEDHQDELKIYGIDMNDIDYANTQHDDDSSKYDDKHMTSYIKYFYNTHDYFMGLEANKYEDLSSDTYTQTLQTRPVIKLHKYTDTVLSDNLTYSSTLELKRQTRENGVGANSVSFNLPLIYTNSYLNDFLDISFGTTLDYVYLDYLNDSSLYEDAIYGSATSFIEAGTSLIKPYSDFIHSIQLSMKYEKPTKLTDSGDIFSLNTNNSALDDFSIVNDTEQIVLYFNQSFTDNDLFTFLDHSISQNWTYNDDTNTYEKGDLEHDLILYYGDTSLSNRFYYDFNLDAIVQSTTVLAYNDKKKYIKFYYNFEKDRDTLKNQEDFIYELGYYFDKYYSLAYKEEYDLTNNVNRKREYIFNIDRQCWAISFKLVNSLIATDRITDETKRQKIFYVQLNLKELFNLSQKFASE